MLNEIVSPVEGTLQFGLGLQLEDGLTASCLGFLLHGCDCTDYERRSNINKNFDVLVLKEEGWFRCCYESCIGLLYNELLLSFCQGRQSNQQKGTAENGNHSRHIRTSLITHSSSSLSLLDMIVIAPSLKLISKLT